MNVCAHCGTPAKPGEKFCSACGGPFVAVQPGLAPGYAQPAQARPSASPHAPPQAGTARCQLGHDIAPGQSYCAFGHPMALDAMQFTGDLYAAPPQYAPPQQPAPQYGAPPPPSHYAPPPPPQQPPPQYAPPPQQPSAPPLRAPYGTHAPPPPQPGYDPHAQAAVVARLPPNALRGFLVSYQANPAGDYWALRGGRMTVGRVGSNDQLDIQLADATISSRHASITVTVGGDGQVGSIVIEDTGSTNGTFVNEEHLGFNGRRELRDGDTIRFGGFNTVVKIVGDQA